VHAGKVSVDLAAKVVKTETKEAQKAFADKLRENPKQQPKSVLKEMKREQRSEPRPGTLPANCFIHRFTIDSPKELSTNSQRALMAAEDCQTARARTSPPVLFDGTPF
jgi:hypothetical protein